MMLLAMHALQGATSPFGAASGAPTWGLLAVLIAICAVFGAGLWLRSRRAARAETLVHGDFETFVLAALANAAKLDGVVTSAEQDAIAQAMSEASNAAYDRARVEAALASASLSKSELIAYLQERSAVFSHDQKVLLLKLLLSVFVADELFDEGEHHALVEYATALGFDRQSAPGQLRGLLSDLSRGRMIT